MQTTAKSRIMVVDDDIHLLRSLADLLKFNGYDVVTAANAETGLKLLENDPPDIVLLDLAMPGMGGMGFLRRILRQDGGLSHPVIVFTARSETEEFFEDVPVEGFIPKPCDEAELLAKIRDVLQRNAAPEKQTVLLGEDEADVARNLAKAFEEAGYAVVVAVSGPEAVEKAVLHKPGILVLKRILGGMNGDAAAALLQTMPRIAGTPVIIYDATGMTREDDFNNSWRSANVRKFLATHAPESLLNAVRSIVPDKR